MADKKSRSKPRLLTVVKVDAARRQIETAILLYFNDGDPLAVHTLTAAASGILGDIAKKKSEVTGIEEMILRLPDKATQDYMRRAIRAPQNFLKHADKKDEGLHSVIEFAPALTDFLLVDACTVLARITGETSLLLRAFTYWFSAKHPEQVADPRDREFYLSVHKEISNTIRLDFLRRFLAGHVVITPNPTTGSEP